MNEVIRALKERRVSGLTGQRAGQEEDLQQILRPLPMPPSGMGAQPVVLVAVRTRRPLPACLS